MPSLAAAPVLRRLPDPLPRSRAAGGWLARRGRQVLGAAVLLQLVQIGVFEVADPRLRLGLAAAGLGCVGLAAGLRLLSGQLRPGPAAWLLAGMLLCWTLSPVLAGGSFTLAPALQQASLGLWFLAVPGAWPGGRLPGLLRGGVLAVVGFALLVALTGPATLVGGIPRPAPFVDAAGIHLAAYVLFGCLVVLAADRGGGGLLRAGGIMVCLGLIVLYKVRTVQIGVLVWAGVLVWYRLTPASRHLLAMLGGGAAFAAAVVAAGSLDLGAFSSGRLAVWGERLGLIGQRPVLPLLFGTGAGSDLMRAAQWWWEAKNAHNDFLTVVIERGLLGLAGLAGFLLVALVRAGPGGRAVLLAALVMSALSNALLARPLAVFLFAMAVALAGANVSRAKHVAGRRG